MAQKRRNCPGEKAVSIEAKSKASTAIYRAKPAPAQQPVAFTLGAAARITATGWPVWIIGRLRRDPVAYVGPLGPYATASLYADDNATPVSAVAFGATAEQLLAFKAGDAVQINGREKSAVWGRAKAVRIIAEKVISAEAQWRDALAAAGVRP
ncbi:MAG TPA: hypothetical protein VFQ90_00205 [Stellaceae bacterium]|nr:hypothetical protein [Stellaceae bacterium]